MSRALSIVSRALIEPLNLRVLDYSPDTITKTKDDLGIEEVTTSKVVQALTMEDVPKGVGVVAEIPKSPHMPRPKKDKQAMAPRTRVPKEPFAQQTIGGREGESCHDRNK